jgi:hypothetical protein
MPSRALESEPQTLQPPPPPLPDDPAEMDLAKEILPDIVAAVESEVNLENEIPVPEPLEFDDDILPPVNAAGILDEQISDRDLMSSDTPEAASMKETVTADSLFEEIQSVGLSSMEEDAVLAASEGPATEEIDDLFKKGTFMQEKADTSGKPAVPVQDISESRADMLSQEDLAVDVLSGLGAEALAGDGTAEAEDILKELEDIEGVKTAEAPAIIPVGASIDEAIDAPAVESEESAASVNDLLSRLEDAASGLIPEAPTPTPAALEEASAPEVPPKPEVIEEPVMDTAVKELFHPPKPAHEAPRKGAGEIPREAVQETATALVLSDDEFGDTLDSILDEEIEPELSEDEFDDVLDDLLTQEEEPAVPTEPPPPAETPSGEVEEFNREIEELKKAGVSRTEAELLTSLMDEVWEEEGEDDAGYDSLGEL